MPRPSTCLKDALTPPAYSVREDAAPGLPTKPPRVHVCWGGTHEPDRLKVAGLDVDEAIDQLEADLPRRLERRIRAWKASPPKNGRGRQLTARIGDLLGDHIDAFHMVKRFHLRGPGPGRGRKGPIAAYAEKHGVSRSTAWRRLRQSAA